MSEIQELYQELVLDHNRRPRNFQKLAGANRTAEGYNPLCGDRITVYVRLEDDVVRDFSFQGSGCAIATAAASMMGESVKGKTTAEAAALLKAFHTMVTTDLGTPFDLLDLGKLAAFAGVREFPIRVKCATLAWHTLRAALEEKAETCSTRNPLVIETNVIEALQTIFDPEIPVNIWEIGLIYGINVDPSGAVGIRMTLTSPNCPSGAELPQEVERKVKAIGGVTAATVEVVFEPPWEKSMMSEAAKLQLNMW